VYEEFFKGFSIYINGRSIKESAEALIAGFSTSLGCTIDMVREPWDLSSQN